MKVKIISALVTILLIYTIVVEDRTADGYFSVKNYVVFYLLYVIVFAIELLYWHIVECIGRRFVKLNECLEIDNDNKLSMVSNKLNKLYTIQLGDNRRNFYNGNGRSQNFSAVELVAKLSEAHGKLFEAVNVINDGFGFLSLVRNDFTIIVFVKKKHFPDYHHELPVPLGGNTVLSTPRSSDRDV